MSNPTQVLTDYINLMIASFHQQNIRQVVIAPGSRSTPVALLLAQAAKRGHFQLYVDVDERSAAFFALGMAKKSQRPTLLLCTSGTAAANFFPAICEAKLSHIPLIVLTTDRPPELTNVGAPQAIDQNRLYGDQVKSFLQLPLPDAQPDVHTYVAFAVQRIVAASLAAPAGPVHLNLPLRKPLMPDLTSRYVQTAVKIEFSKTQTQLTPAALAALQLKLSQGKLLIVAGPTTSLEQHQPLLTFAKRYHVPILADPLSQLRQGTNDLSITCSDLVFKTTKALPAALKPDLILRIGTTMVSAALGQWLATRPCPIYYIDPNQRLDDYTKATTTQLPVSENWFFENCQLQMPPAQRQFSLAWQQLQQHYQHWLSQHLTTLDEASVPYFMSQHLSSSQIFISNSMPIRDFDNFFAPNKGNFTLLCNRGANGIDGVISTALGTSLHEQRPNFLVTGDLAFFHDMNGLMLTTRYRFNLTIILINNNGGGIFSFLPQAKATAYFETLFGTPQNLDVAAVSQLYHANYQLITSKSAFETAISQPQSGLTILEIKTDRPQNTKRHQQLTQSWQREMEQFYATAASKK
ncbi:MAG: 2-succinyl-5-enolpyruvyl-6-hydroxy-3-cyclohexene-1-carboxylic-acid synthase [Lactobacillus sp.]|jgi:2-succinyl-5-enolpyruvyl-6-hydroxy-3-cyclohexene-1-carboxylate synthase|nr:2-succinyl-5-enolpyruvyl-6-hydroxy-3-cyclohexene-1-carboxylic-acid synthase [Lactobacillus sp.]